jgi:hypothetical protein
MVHLASTGGVLSFSGCSQVARAARAPRFSGPGSVWGMDFVQRAVLIAGCYPYVLAVRDLGSQHLLL